MFIRHRNHKGIWYNIDIASKAFPGMGSIETITYTTDEAITKGYALKNLDEKESVALCLVYLAKSYEYKLGKRNDNFMLQCAETALQYAPLCLNALLLKMQVQDAQLLQAMNEKNIQHIQEINKDALLHKLFTHLETTIAEIYNTGYREMPYEKRQLVLNTLKGEQTGNMINEPLKPLPNATAPVAAYATISNGTFTERIDAKEKESFGNSIFNTKTQTIESIIKKENTIDEVLFGWAIDPYAHKFPYLSPYTFAANNPLIYIDPDDNIVRLAGNYNPIALTSVITRAFNGLVEASVKTNASGSSFLALEFAKGYSIENLNTTQRATYLLMKSMIDPSKIYTINVEKDGEQFEQMDDYIKGEIYPDKIDILGNNAEYSKLSIFYHAFKEQKVKHEKNYNRPVVIDDYLTDHNETMESQKDELGYYWSTGIATNDGKVIDVDILTKDNKYISTVRHEMVNGKLSITTFTRQGKTSGLPTDPNELGQQKNETLGEYEQRRDEYSKTNP